MRSAARACGGCGAAAQWRAPGAGNLRWTAPESWHITLQFLGNATPEQLRMPEARLGEVRAAPVPVRAGRAGLFRPRGRVLCRCRCAPELAALEHCVVAATSQCGFVAETRPFHPHITLARAKGQGRGAELRDLKGKIRSQPPFTRFTAREFLLYESHLGPGARGMRSGCALALERRSQTSVSRGPRSRWTTDILKIRQGDSA